jgi:hypothetical protein
MKRSETQLLAGIAVFLQLLLGSSFALGQTKVIDITVDDPRPMAYGIGIIQGLSGIPINYEDMPVFYASDIKVADFAAQAPVPPGTSRTLVARGGQLSVPIVVDATTGRLNDIQAVEIALTALVSAYNSSDLPGDFEFEQLNGVFFVRPVRYRDATGATQPMTPLLSTPVTFPVETRQIFSTWRLILDQVSKVAGIQIGFDLGMGAIGGQRTLGAQDEPAHRVIARLLSGNGPTAASVNASWDAGLSYSFLCQPQYGCALNVHRARPFDLCRGSGCEPYSPPPTRGIKPGTRVP